MLFINEIDGKTLNNTNVESEETNTTFNVSMNINSTKLYKLLKAPVVFKLEDLMMCLSLLLMLLIIFIVWYFLTRLFIHLAYRTPKKKNKDLDEIEEELLSSS